MIKRIPTMKKSQIHGELLLTMTAMLWGACYVAQRVGMDYLGPFTFTASRFLLGAVSMIPVIIIMNKINKSRTSSVPAGTTGELLKGGIACGVVLFGAISFQQTGMVYTTASKAGFITALYIVMVPIFGLFLHKKIERSVWAGVSLAVAGLYLLCVKEGLTMSKGDFIVLCSTVFWAAHILTIDHFVHKVDSLKMSFLQFVVAGMLSLFAALFTETIVISDIIRSAGPILFTAIFVVNIAYSFQVLGQRNTKPTIAAIILSLESVFAVIFGMFLLGEQMTMREIIGCVLMFSAVILAQRKPFGKPKRRLFDRIASYYGLFYQYQRRKYKKLLGRLSDELGLNQYQDVIDVGCGTGALCSELSERGFRVTGLDSSSEMLRVARKKLMDENIRLYRSDFLQGTPFGDKSFDISLSSFVLHGMPYHERKKLYQEMQRITKHAIIIYDYNDRRSFLIDIVERLEGGDYFNFINNAGNEIKDHFNDFSVIDVGGHASCYVIKLK
jgi:drug/metabolite transporter (DMT)-like permease